MENKILKLSAFITNFKIWDDTINLYVKAFYRTHNVYPNIFLACEHTHRKIDLYAQIHAEKLKADSDYLDCLYKGINSFVGDDYELQFCIENKLQEAEFMLVFDNSPDFDGEPIPDENKEIENQYNYYRLSA